MQVPELIQLVGVIVSGLIVIDALLTQIREWREGSPELRLLKRTIDRTQSDHTDLLRKILEKIQ